MTKQLMFYEDVVPVRRERHGGWSVAQGGRHLGFAAESNAVPLMSSEFLQAATEYPIVFAGAEEEIAPVVVLGLERGRSLYVDAQGNWTGAYVPAFVRRYPFVFSRSEDGETYTLCIDEAYEGCDQTGRSGDPLYTAEGQPSPFLQRALEFTRNVEIEHQRTREFCRLLVEHELLDQMEASITMPDGSKRSLSGFRAVTRERLKRLEGTVLEDFFRRDVLELVYYHLASLRNLEKLPGRAAG